MEKLEAALIKAREMRKSALSSSDTLHERPGARGLNDNRKPGRDTADWTALPLLEINSQRALSNRLTTLLGGKDATPYDMLRSRAIRIMREKGWSRLAVTSPDAGCGKTTVSLNLALSLARQKDLKILLIDLDLRRPSLHRLLDHVPTRSVFEVLRGEAKLEEASARIGTNLVVAMNAESCRQPSELLQSSQARDALAEIEQRWQPDLIIFDMSPILASDDNVGFLPNVDCALLVAAAESTSMPNIDICEKEIAQLTNVLGIVLNKCRYADDSVGYSYGNYG
jgi:capsular exopolysaccharide synthesis family protein